MKNTTLIFGLICILSRASYAQDSNKTLFNEFALSVNSSSFHDNNTLGRTGFGIGIYHAFMPYQKLNILTGLEYNRTNQFKSIVYEGHFANLTDVRYHLNTISLPIGLRLIFGTIKRYFIESGGFADLMLSSNRLGTLHSYTQNENGQYVDTERKINWNTDLSNSFGFNFGFGMIIPMSKFDLMVKPEFKIGINNIDSRPYQNELYNSYFRLNIGLKLK